MQEADLFGIFLRRLSDAGIRYMVTGSVASIIYGEPRMTHDIDVVLELHSDKVNFFVQVFPENEFYHPPLEVIQTEIRRETRGHFNLIHHDTGFKADIYPVGDDQLHRWAMEHRRCIDFQDMKVWVAPPEYVILRKLEFYEEGRSQKHLKDIAAMVQISRQIIDTDVIRTKAAQMGLSDLLTQIPGFAS
jgi:hypothetical protein